MPATDQARHCLAGLQRLLETFYQLSGLAPVADFLRTDLGARESVLLCEAEQSVQLAVCLPRPVLDQLAQGGGLSIDVAHRLPDCLLQAIEAVSHYVFLASRLRHGHQVTLLEAELQAEVDKFVVCLWLTRYRDTNWSQGDIHQHLFTAFTLREGLPSSLRQRYRTANHLAGKFCLHLTRHHRTGPNRTRHLRRFYRLTGRRKMRWVEGLRG